MPFTRSVPRDDVGIKQAASAYRKAGYAIVRVPPQSKNPGAVGWQSREYTPDDLAYEDNISLKPGEPSGGLVDVDLDCSEALTLADGWLPRTDMESGRETTPRSHRWYQVTGRIPATCQRKDVDGSMLVELRSSGAHTLVPPSVYPGGEPCVWSRQGEPASVTADELERAIDCIGAVSLLARHWPATGSRHDAAKATAGLLLRGGLDVETTARIVVEAARLAGDEQAKDRRNDVDSTATNLYSRPTTGGPTLADLMGAKVVARLTDWLDLHTTTPRDMSSTDEELTDTGNAVRFAREYGDMLKYVPQWGWLAYCDGKWHRDAEGAATQCAKDCIRRLQRDAVEVDDTGRRDRLLAHAVRSFAEHKLRAMLNLAQSEPGIAAKVEDFDTHPWLFNVRNGTIDLRSGELCDHDPADLLTQQSPVEYDPDAEAQRWEAFLEDIFSDDAELVAYVQRALGYCLTGETREQCYFNPYGSGGNGKSTMLGAVAFVMGDYAGPLKADALVARSFHSGGGPDPELAALVGKRLVIAQEPRDGGKLDTARVKALTGGDALQVHAKHGHPFTLVPQFKLWFSTNGRPEVSETSEGIWRRIRSIPFTARFATKPEDGDGKRQANDKLLEELREEAPGILAWLVRGALAWQHEKLGTAEAVSSATRAYREDSDPYLGFFMEMLVHDASSRGVELAQARIAYEEWQMREHAPFLGRNDFSRQLEAHGFIVRPSNGKRWVRACHLT